MRKKKKNNLTKIILFIIAFSLYFLYDNITTNIKPSSAIPTTPTINVSSNLLTVSFLDVGQADCTLIENNGKYMLIDAGNNADGSLLVNYFKSQNITSFEYVVATHAHEDHIGGMDDIINNFKVKNFYMPDVVTTTKTFEDLLTALENAKVAFKTPKIGTTLYLDDSTSLKPEITFLYSDSSSEELNDTSIALRVKYGTTSFLFMGDASSKVESKLLSENIKSDCLKVGHHGSKTSSSTKFLEAVDPQYAIISSGKDNSYSHPHKETLKRLNNKNIKIYRTDESGTIIATSNGTLINFETRKTKTNG